MGGWGVEGSQFKGIAERETKYSAAKELENGDVPPEQFMMSNITKRTAFALLHYRKTYLSTTSP